MRTLLYSLIFWCVIGNIQVYALSLNDFVDDKLFLNQEDEIQVTSKIKTPELVWEYDGIGNGYSSPAINSDFVFVTGEIDTIGYLFKFNRNGDLIWKNSYGKEWSQNFPGTRSAPTIYKNLVFVCSALGEITCFDISSGLKKWSLSMITDLKGTNNVYGYSTQLLIDNDVLFCLPGGSDINIAALDCFTGKFIWTSKGKQETPGYGNAIMVEFPKRKVFICFTEFSLLGLDAKSGELLWSQNLDDFGEIPCNTPIYDDGYLYYSAGAKNGMAKLQISEDGSSIKEIWKNLKFDVYFSGFIKITNYLYGSANSYSSLVGINAQTGVIGEPISFKKGSIVVANGLIYCYNEVGIVGIVEPNNGQLKLLSSFKITKGTKEHFAHPVYNEGELFIRHGDTLLVYNINAKD
ncbi:MAG: PQQ-binding-like beta-propeller repeat protein [Bacteroidales bacterium]|nr:PQQ-binding-like beta-propeller repeat protein [Bacteroidales bacterium]